MTQLNLSQKLKVVLTLEIDQEETKLSCSPEEKIVYL